MANTLTNLASSTLYLCHVELNVMARPSIHEATVLTTEPQACYSWISPISSYLRYGTLPEDKSEANKIKAQATRYTLLNDVLYRRSFSGPYKRCVPPNEAKCIIEHVYRGICSTYIGGQSLCHRIMMQGF